LRCWQEQTRYDAHDCDVEAASLEDAAALLDALQEQAQAVAGAVELPATVRRSDGSARVMPVLDPDEVVDGVRGITEIDANGRKQRDVLPRPADTAAAVLAEFVRDVEAVGIAVVRQDWPDLLVTYPKARAALARSAEDS
jgi:hypothetical protein